jgi:hypothetical protein
MRAATCDRDTSLGVMTRTDVRAGPPRNLVLKQSMIYEYGRFNIPRYISNTTIIIVVVVLKGNAAENRNHAIN